MRFHIEKIWFLALFLGLAACETTATSKLGETASAANNVQFQNIELPKPDSTVAPIRGELRIEPHDQIELDVFGTPELGGKFQVDNNGRIKMPLLGEVNALGYTSMEFSRIVELQLGEKYLQNPDVSVSILNTKTEKITVEGSVTKPGIYDIESDISMLQALALAGGPTDFAAEKRILIVRQIGGKRQAAVFDLKKVRSGEQVDPVIYGNDIVVVDGNQTKRAYREIIQAVPLLAFFRLF